MKDNQGIYSPPFSSFPLSLDPHRQARIDHNGILHYGKAGYKVVEKAGDNGWYTQKTEAMHNRAHLLATAPFSHQTHIDKLKSWTIECYITARLAIGQWKRPETMDGIYKDRKRSTGRGERIMWTALFFPLGFDEVAHDLGYGRSKSNATRIHFV